MPPDRSRTESRDRAEQAFQFRCEGHTWQEVADRFGFASRSAATTAVQAFLQRETPDDVGTSRRYSAEGYRLVIGVLMKRLRAQESAEVPDDQALVALGRSVGYLIDKRSRLMGEYVPVEQHIQVQVKSSAQLVVEDARQQFRAIAERTVGALEAAPVVDGEVVE